MKTKIRVFLFHRVSPQRDLLWNPMTPELFTKIISHLNKKYEIVPLEQTLLSEFRPSGKKKLCAITFDDGYKDFMEYAFPILQKFKAPSSMYIVSDCADKNIPPWTYIINHLFIHTSHLSLNLQSNALPPDLLKNPRWKNRQDRISYARIFAPLLKQLNDAERLSVYEQVISGFNDVAPPQNPMMNWDQIREIARNNCEIGSHSMSHPLLGKISLEEKIRQEVVESGKKIKTETGKFPLSISYPFGSYNETVKKISMEAGYKIGLTVKPEEYNSDRDDLMEVPRTELYDEPFIKSNLRINGVITMLNRLKG